MNKHTPGPWRLARQNGSPTTGEWMIAGANPGYLAEVRDCGNGDVKANALLIAAAPELLDALEAVVNSWSSQFERNGHLAPEWCKQARAAMEKAKGA